jgi:hypothetical protein
VTEEARAKADKGEYFAWIPTFLGAIPANGTEFSWPGNCFTENKGIVSVLPDGAATMTLQFSNPVSSTCEELYAFGTVNHVQLINVKKDETHTVSWPGNLEANQIAWIQRNGFRVFRFNGTGDETIGQLVKTVSLFYPALLQGDIPEDALQRNAEFLQNQAYYTMERRVITEVTLDESQINDGDFFGVCLLSPLVNFF